MSETSPVEALDGRRLRSPRSRESVVDAALDLIADGTLVPSAQEISEHWLAILLMAFGVS